MRLRRFRNVSLAKGNSSCQATFVVASPASSAAIARALLRVQGMALSEARSLYAEEPRVVLTVLARVP